MDGWKTLCKHYFKFHRYEIQSLVIFCFLFTMVSLFRIPDEITLFGWIINFVLTFAIFLGLLIGRLSMQKIFSLSQGYVLRYKPFWEGTMLTTFIGVLSLGYIFVPMLGSFHTDFLKRQRLGKFFYGYDYHEHALIIFMTTLVTLFAAIMFRALSLYVDWFVLDKVVYFLVVLSLAQILPVPWLEGLQVFFGNRFLYSFLSMFSLIVAVLLFIPSTITTVLALIITTFVGVISILWN